MTRCWIRRFRQTTRRRCCELHHSIGLISRRGSCQSRTGMATSARPGWYGSREPGSTTRERRTTASLPRPLKSGTDANSPTLPSAPCAGYRNSTPQLALPPAAVSTTLLSFSTNSLCLSFFSSARISQSVSFLKLSHTALNCLTSVLCILLLSFPCVHKYTCVHHSFFLLQNVKFSWARVRNSLRSNSVPQQSKGSHRWFVASSTEKLLEIRV
jgi:hypothetical protein